MVSLSSLENCHNFASVEEGLSNSAKLMMRLTYDNVGGGAA